jgi:starch synthase
VRGARGGCLNIVMVASEVSPWAKTGGLGDVTSALPAALGRLGHRVTVIVPKYRGISLPDAVVFARPITTAGRLLTVTFHLAQTVPGVRIVMVDLPTYFDREGYYGLGNMDYADNAERFAGLAAAALEFAEHDPSGTPPDVIHAHDWQAGLVPVILSTAASRYPRLQRAARVFTIHNLAYQGRFPREVVPALGLPWSVFSIETGEFWGQFSFLKAGLTSSDMLTTVSPTYAGETQTAALGFGLEGVLAARRNRYVGILNGIDTDVWNPAEDPYLPAHYDARDFTGKTDCKRALLARFGLAFGDDAVGRPVIGMVSRLVPQKGIDLVEAASDELAALNATWIVVGLGDPRLEAFLRTWAAQYPSRVGVHIGLDESLAHLVEAGSDILLMPSRFEPCGLNQMYSLRYGTVPVVHAVGGLEDTVQPYAVRARRANGFTFHEPSAAAMTRVLRQAVRLYDNRPAWEQLMRVGMAADHSWETSAREYVKVYRRARYAAAARAAG